jgi:hypothetical protein
MDLIHSLIHAIVSTCYFYRHAWVHLYTWCTHWYMQSWAPVLSIGTHGYTCTPDTLTDTCNREHLLFLSARMVHLYTLPDALTDTCNREYLLFLSARMVHITWCPHRYMQSWVPVISIGTHGTHHLMHSPIHAILSTCSFYRHAYTHLALRYPTLSHAVYRSSPLQCM